MIIACSAAKLIAEGLETLQQLDYLLDLGCDEYQGYCFSKALVAIILSVTYEAWRARMLDLVFVVLKLSKTRLFHLVYDYLLDLLFKANTIANFKAPVAQLDRVLGYEPSGQEFESLLAHHTK